MRKDRRWGRRHERKWQVHRSRWQRLAPTRHHTSNGGHTTEVEPQLEDAPGWATLAHNGKLLRVHRYRAPRNQ
jgi:hypothetical protein